MKEKQRKAGNPREKILTHRVTTYLPDELGKAIEAHAAEADREVSEFYRRLIKKGWEAESNGKKV
jgi:hypothetical protein